MSELIYVLRFTGQAAPSSSDGNVLIATTTALWFCVTTTAGPNGLQSALGPHEGEDASFAPEVTFTGQTSFQETGTISASPPSAAAILTAATTRHASTAP
jgi:hypothetical protein